jgi:hypothetical protein
MTQNVRLQNLRDFTVQIRNASYFIASIANRRVGRITQARHCDRGGIPGKEKGTAGKNVVCSFYIKRTGQNRSVLLI